MNWHVYKSFDHGHARVQGNRVDTKRFAENLLLDLATNFGADELAGAVIAIEHGKGVERFRIAKRADGSLAIDGARPVRGIGNGS